MLCVFLARAPVVIKLSDGLTIPMITGVGSGVQCQVRGHDGPKSINLACLRLTSVKAAREIQNILPPRFYTTWMYWLTVY